jgi:colanic acid biosynthesis glycosyl transferase WcaI
MRILMLTQWFDPEPPAFKSLLFARALRDLGHDVEVLTGFPNYPGGKLYEGYELHPYRRETMEGIVVHRVWLYPSHDKSAIRRIMNYASFALSAALLGPWVATKPDVVYVYHPPGTVALPAIAFRLLRGVPFVYDIQDLWPDTLVATGMLSNTALLTLVGLWSRLSYRLAGGITVLSPGFKERLVMRGVPAAKINVIYNWCDESQAVAAPLNSDLAVKLGLAGRFNVMFAGTMGKAQGLDAVLDAARLLSSTHPHVQLVFVGGGVDVERLKCKTNELDIENVLFLARRPVSEIGPIMQLADVLLVHLRDDPLFAITIPSKTQSYMAIGKPILMAVRGNAATLIEAAGAGVSCTPEDSRAIADSISQLADMPAEKLSEMGRNGLRYYQREFALAVGARHFERLLCAVSKQPVSVQG